MYKPERFLASGTGTEISAIHPEAINEDPTQYVFGFEPR